VNDVQPSGQRAPLQTHSQIQEDEIAAEVLQEIDSSEAFFCQFSFEQRVRFSLRERENLHHAVFLAE